MRRARGAVSTIGLNNHPPEVCGTCGAPAELWTGDTPEPRCFRCAEIETELPGYLESEKGRAFVLGLVRQLSLSATDLICAAVAATAPALLRGNPGAPAPVAWVLEQGHKNPPAFPEGAVAATTGEARTHHVTGETRPLVRLDKVSSPFECVRWEGQLYYCRQDEHGEVCLCRKAQAVYRTSGRVVRICTAPESTQGLLVRPVNDPMEGLIAVPEEIVAWVSKEPTQ